MGQGFEIYAERYRAQAECSSGELVPEDEQTIVEDLRLSEESGFPYSAGMKRTRE